MDTATENRRSFWTTVPGILTALAAIITAVAGLVGVLAQGRSAVSESHPAGSTSTSTPRGSPSSTATSGPFEAQSAPSQPYANRSVPNDVADARTPRPVPTTPTTTPRPTASPTTTSTTVPRARVEATLRADPFSGTARCPVTVVFSGRISLLSGSGTVAYRFDRSDGASAPVQTVTFTGPGSKDVSTTWQLGGAGSQLQGWERLTILDPEETRSEQATFNITCA